MPNLIKKDREADKDQLKGVKYDIKPTTDSNGSNCNTRMQ